VESREEAAERKVLLLRLSVRINVSERQIMDFTPKTNVGRVVNGILTAAVVGLIGWASRVASAPQPIVATQDAFAMEEFLQTSDPVPIFPAVEWAPEPGLQTARPDYYQLAAWYKNKHWWKRNAPIVGGAAGGALVGGLVGGGKGALIGGAAGGGGGYLYKRSKHHYHHHHHRY
jgi:hypothetical protein